MSIEPSDWSLIYVEDQYVWSDLVADGIADALRREPDLRFIAARGHPTAKSPAQLWRRNSRANCAATMAGAPTTTTRRRATARPPWRRRVVGREGRPARRTSKTSRAFAGPANSTPWAEPLYRMFFDPDGRPRRLRGTNSM